MTDTYLALDLSGKRDLTAAARAWFVDDVLCAELRFWTPQETVQRRETSDRVPYQAWIDAEHLKVVPGRSIDYGFVVRDMTDWLKDATALAFDQWRIDDFVREMDDAGIDSYIWEGPESKQRANGIRMVRHGQGFGGGASVSTLWMPRSISTLEELVLSGRLKVRKNPVLTWNSASAVLEQDATGNKKWEKRKSTGRIDGIVALCMAAGLADSAPVATASVYETRDPIVL